MKSALFSTLLVALSFISYSQQLQTYRSLDPNQHIKFSGKFIVFEGDTITLGPKAFFIDGQLTDEDAAKFPFVFNSVNKAAEHLTDGIEASPMTLYIAPYVYWIDDPDDTAIRVGDGQSPPYGLIVKCEWLKFHGLSNDPRNVVLACNRGQTIGAKGNFTMFKFIGQGTGSENITFGNYCNIDLDYPLLPKLSRPKRASAIVQAQLIHCNGDKILARNTRFVSRLNLCPFVGGKRVMFDRCHFESTDDALCGTGVYLHCTLDFYGSKPFYRTIGTGAVFLDCDMRSFTQDRQFFTKANGQLAVVDTRIMTEPGTYIGWNDDLPDETRNYQYNVTQNGSKVFIGKSDSAGTVDMTNEEILEAYKITTPGKQLYNTYNLLRGDDDWDPMQVKDFVQEAEQGTQRNYSLIPVQLLISPTDVSIETGKSSVKLTAKAMRFGNYPAVAGKIIWSVAPQFRTVVRLEVSADGLSCNVVPTNSNDDIKKVIVTASTPSGLEAASVVNVAPAILPAPGFSQQPALKLNASGMLHLNYLLQASYKDESIVNWYRCTDVKGSNAIKVAVSRNDKPFTDYPLSVGDIGYFIRADIQPKHVRSDTGKASSVILPKAITANDIKASDKMIHTDFSNVAVGNQPKIIPGFWTWDHLEIPTNESRYKADTTKDAWFFGEGVDGASGMNGLLQGRSASMLYTPVGKSYGDMTYTLKVAPFKTAGQAFSVAHLYMDVLIKFDTKTMTGYALRFIRTTKHHNAVDCMFVQYDHGKITAISEHISTTCFRTMCTIMLSVEGNKLTAKASTTADDLDGIDDSVQPSVNISTNIKTNEFGGFGIQYNGGSPTMISDVEVKWK